VLLSLIVIGVLAVIVVIGINATSQHQPTGSSSAAQTQAATVNDVLTESAKSRRELAKALPEAERCSDMPRAIDRLKRVASERRSEVKAAAAASVGALPSGAALLSDLTRALRDSLHALEDYLKWARQWAACSAPPVRTRPYHEGVSASRAATADKKAFLQLWDPLAARYGMPDWPQGKI
jgi:type II secretory pathway pseudopilin PulG